MRPRPTIRPAAPGDAPGTRGSASRCVEKETNGRPEGLAAVLTHHASAHFPPRFGLFPFAFHGRGLVVFAALDFLHDAVALAFAFETTKSFFDGLPVSNFDKNHGR